MQMSISEEVVSTRSKIENDFHEKLNEVNEFIETQLKNCEHQISEIRALMHKNTEEVKTLITSHIGLGEAAAQSAVDVQQTLIAQMNILQGKAAPANPVKEVVQLEKLEASIATINANSSWGNNK
jgi:hypothetical protein